MRGRACGPGRLWKHGSSWVLDWRDEHGVRRRKTLSDDRRTAERIRSEIIHRRDLALAGLGSEAGQELGLRELLGQYLADLSTRASAMHIKNVSQRLEFVVEQLNGARVGDLRPMDVLRVRSAAVAGGASNRTANLLVDRLHALLRWAEDNALIAKNPLSKVKRLPTAGHEKYKRRALTEDEIQRFLAASEFDDEQCALIADFARVPQTPLWLALLETGARYGEARQLVWGDLDLTRATMVLRAESTKSRKQRVIPLRPSLIARLRSLRVVHEAVLGRLPNVADTVFLSPEGHAYPRPSNNVNRLLRRLLDRAGIARIDTQGRRLDVHSLRHTFASRLARNGVGLFQAQKLLGHSDPKLTSAVYAHVDAEDLRPAIDALPELSSADAPAPSRAKEAT